MPRLIDADALSQKWQDVLKEKADEKDSVAYQTFELFIDRLKDEPTIEAEPVRHRTWVIKTHDDGYGAYQVKHCPDCDRGLPVEYDADYCPKCGAKMDGGKKE